MRKKVLTALATTAALLALGTSAMAAEYTTTDGVVTLTLPDDTWTEISDPNTWVTLGNGTDTITLMHFANGENLPDMVTADSTYTKKYQAVLSDIGEVIMVTGSVKNTDDYDAVVKAVQSAKVKKGGNGTAAASTSQTAATEATYAVTDADAVEYVIAASGLNVRPTYSAADGINVLGILPYGTEVHVTGIVTCNGEDFGWRRIDYNGSSAYVSRALLDTSEPAAQTSSSSTAGTSASGSTVWEEPDASNNHNGNNDPDVADGTSFGFGDDIQLKASDGSTVYVYLYNGSYIDNQQTEYYAEGAGQWSDEYGNTYSVVQ